MKALLVILLGLALGVAVAQVALKDPGYVLITLNPWSIELSLVTFLALLAATLFVLYVVVRALVRLGAAPRVLREWRQKQLLSKARQSHDRGMLYLMNGEWAKAEKRLISYIDHALHPTLNWLAAARAADGRGDTEQRDHYLSQVRTQDEQEKLALVLTRAELQANGSELEPALDSLRALRHQAPKNTKVLALLAQVQEQLEHWRGLMDTVKEARRLGALSETECERLETLAASRLLRASPKEELSGLWHSLPRNVSDQTTIIDTYAERLIMLDQHDEAEELLRKAVEREWRSVLAQRYGQVRSKNLIKQLKTAEQWAATHDNDPQVMLTLAHLSLANQLWGKARAALEACIANGGSAEAYRELGHLLENLDDSQSALSAYREGLDQAGDTDSAPPKLKSVQAS